MFVTMFIFSIATFLIGVCGTMYFKHVPLSMLVNPSAIFLLFFVLLSVLVATRGIKTFKYGLKAAMFPHSSVPEEERGRAASLFRLLSKMAGLAAVIGAILGIIAALWHINDIEVLGQSLAAALTAPLWALMLIVSLFEPVVYLMKKRQGEERRAKNSD